MLKHQLNLHCMLLVFLSDMKTNNTEGVALVFLVFILPISLFSFLPKYLKANPRPPIHLLASIYIYIRTLRGFLGGSEGKESTCSVGDLGLITGLERSPGGGHGNPLQYSCLETPTDRGAWWAAVYGVAKSRT